MMTRQEVEKLYDMITVDAALAINLAGFGISQGAEANLVILDSPDVIEALRFHGPPAHVISRGLVLDQDRMRALALAPPIRRTMGEW
jgi:cytosine/creatinine deaminase